MNQLIYGEPGTGKTYYLGTAMDHEDTRPMLLIDVEGGTTTLRHRTDIDVVSIRSVRELEEMYTKLFNSIDVEKNSMYYKTIGIDTLSELQKLDMRDIMKELVARRPDLDPDVPSQREWGKSSEHMRRIVRGFRDLPCNTIFTCHAAADKDQATNVTTYAPMLPGKLKTEVAGFLDIVGYLYTATEDGELVRKVQFAKTQRIIAKDRTNALGDVIVNPTVPMLWDMIHGSYIDEGE